MSVHDGPEYALSHEAAALLQIRYLGRWISVPNLIVSDVVDRRDHWLITASQERRDDDAKKWIHVILMLKFDNQHGPRLATLKKGASISVIGQISKNTYGDVLELEHCEIKVLKINV
jgi:hypothetical protein